MNNETQYLASYNLGKLSHVRGRIGWKGLKSHEYTEEGPYLIAGTHIKGDKIQWDECQHINQFRYDESPEIKLNVNDIIISKDGTIGRIALIDSLPGPTTINSTMMLVRLKNQDVLCSEFIFYFLQGEKFKKLVAERVAGSGVPHLFQADMKTLTVLAPSIEKQQKIAKILSTVDNLIDQTQNLIDKYTAVKRGMLADLFSRGIDLSGTPETNKSYGQLRPSYEDAPELYQETELGWVPKDWDIKAIGEFSEVKGGKRLPAGEPFANEVTPYPYLRVTDMVDGWIDDTNLEYVSSKIAAIISRYKIYESDIYVTIAGTLGLFGRIPSHLNGAQLTENAARITSFDTSKYNPDYLCSYLRSDKLIPQLYKAIGVGAGVPKLALYQIEQFKIPVPTFREQEELVKRIVSSTELIAKERKYLNKLKLKKKGLMQDLLTGKVKV